MVKGVEREVPSKVGEGCGESVGGELSKECRVKERSFERESVL